MGVQNPNSTNYVHSDEPNLLNLHKAMQYRNDGTPELRVNSTFDGNIVITGNVNIPGTVQVESSHDHPVHTHADELGNIDLSNTWMPVAGNVTIDSGNVTVWQGTTPWVTTGNANVTVVGNVAGITTLPAITGNVGVSGNVDITQMPGVTVTNFPSNVSITQMPAVHGNVSVTQGTSPWIVSGNVTVHQEADTPSLVKYINTPNNLQMDMTQRLRVSPPTQSWWYAPTVDKDGDLRYIESATGTNAGSIFVQNLSSINMSSGTDSNGSFIRISRRRHKMRPGASMSAAFSINWNGYVPDSNVTKRVGVFTPFNGIFYEMTSDLQAVIRRRLTDGTLVEKRIARADFNIDKLDGTGESGYDLRPVVINTSTITAFVSKTAVPITGDGTVYQVVFTVATPGQFTIGMKGRITGVSPALFNGTVIVTAISGNNVTFVYNVDPGSFSSLASAKFEHSAFHNQFVFGFDFNGNRATSVRFFIDGPLGRVAIHQEDFGGELSSPFSNAPAVSTRYEIFNSVAPGRLPNFTCSSEVINVEAESELNPSFGVAHAQVSVPFNKNTDIEHEFAVLGIGLRAGEPYQRADLQIQRVQFTDLGNLNPQNAAIFEWSLILNPTVSAVPSPTNIGKASRMWDYAAGTTVTGGIRLTGGYFQGTQQMEVQNALNFLNLGSNIAYDDADRVVLVAKMLVGGSSNSLMRATINYIEAL